MAALPPSVSSPAAQSPLPFGWKEVDFPPLECPAPGSVRRLAASFSKGCAAAAAKSIPSPTRRSADSENQMEDGASAAASPVAVPAVSTSGTVAHAVAMKAMVSNPSVAAAAASVSNLAMAEAGGAVMKDATPSFAAALSQRCCSTISMHQVSSFYPTSMKGDVLSLCLPESLFEKREQLFSSTAMIGRLLLRRGEQPWPTLRIRNELQQVWQLKRSWKLIAMGKGFYTIRFSDAADFASVRCPSSVSLSGGSFSVRKWTANFDPSSVSSKFAQVWVRIKKLPLHLWEMETIASILKPVGQPLELDSSSLDGSIGFYVRALVDVDMSKAPITKLWIDRGTKSFTVEFEFENLPMFCSRCQMVGHKLANCRRNRRKVEKVAPPREESRAAREPEKAWVVTGSKSVAAIRHQPETVAEIQREKQQNVGHENVSPPRHGNSNKFTVLTELGEVEEDMEMEKPPNAGELAAEKLEQVAAPHGAIVVGTEANFDPMTMVDDAAAAVTHTGSLEGSGSTEADHRKFMAWAAMQRKIEEENVVSSARNDNAPAAPTDDLESAAQDKIAATSSSGELYAGDGRSGSTEEDNIDEKSHSDGPSAVNAPSNKKKRARQKKTIIESNYNTRSKASSQANL